MAVDPKSLTVNYLSLLKKMSIPDRVAFVSSSFGLELMNSLTPAQRAALFPKYIRESLPSFSGGPTTAGLSQAMSGFKPEAVAGQGETPEVSGTGQSGQQQYPSEQVEQAEERKKNLPTSSTYKSSWQRRLEEEYTKVTGKQLPTSPQTGTYPLVKGAEVSRTDATAPPIMSNSGAIKIDRNGAIDPNSFYRKAVDKVRSSRLNGFVPKDGAKYGIVTGAPEEWGRLFTMMGQQESGLRIAKVNPDGTLQKFRSTIPSEASYSTFQFNKGEYGLNTWEDVNNPERNIDALLKLSEQHVMKKGVIRGQEGRNWTGLASYFGSIRRPNETLQHSGWFNRTIGAVPPPSATAPSSTGAPTPDETGIYPSGPGTMQPVQKEAKRTGSDIEGYDQSGMSKTQIENYIRQEARKRGIDPEAAVKVARTEGMGGYQSSVVNRSGQRERSYGPYQLYMGGGLGNEFKKQTGIDPETDRSERSVKMQVQFALDYAAKTGNWDPWHGVKNNGLSRTMGLSDESRPIGITEPELGIALEPSQQQTETVIAKPKNYDSLPEEIRKDIESKPIPEQNRIFGMMSELETQNHDYVAPLSEALKQTNDPAAVVSAITESPPGQVPPVLAGDISAAEQYSMWGSKTNIPTGRERSVVRKKGGVVINLDTNSGAGKDKQMAPMIVIPDDATPAERKAAKAYVDRVSEIYKEKFGKSLPGIVKTRSENGRGRNATIHTEPYNVEDSKAVQYFRDDPEGVAKLGEAVATTLGTIPGAKISLPHGGHSKTIADRGASTQHTNEVLNAEPIYDYLNAREMTRRQQQQQIENAVAQQSVPPAEALTPSTPTAPQPVPQGQSDVYPQGGLQPVPRQSTEPSATPTPQSGINPNNNVPIIKQQSAEPAPPITEVNIERNIVPPAPTPQPVEEQPPADLFGVPQYAQGGEGQADNVALVDTTNKAQPVVKAMVNRDEVNSGNVRVNRETGRFDVTPPHRTNPNDIVDRTNQQNQQVVNQSQEQSQQGSVPTPIMHNQSLGRESNHATVDNFASVAMSAAHPFKTGSSARAFMSSRFLEIPDIYGTGRFSLGTKGTAYS